MRRVVHLVRHGEVANPRHLVYSDLPGFLLNERGKDEAAATAAHLATRPIAVVVSSPLERAVATAEAVAGVHDLAVHTDDRLVEWRLARRWAGEVWEDLPRVRPGELEAYLEHPDHLPFSPESAAELADRVIDAVADALAATRHGDLVVVSHQDPLQSARLVLTGRPLHRLHQDKPGHGSVTSLRQPRGEAGAWLEVAYWEPPGPGHRFPPIPAGSSPAHPAAGPDVVDSAGNERDA